MGVKITTHIKVINNSTPIITYGRKFYMGPPPQPNLKNVIHKILVANLTISIG